MRPKPFMIAISGGSGSGKSTIVRLLEERTSKDIDILVMEQDHYYRDLSHLTPAERSVVNFDDPSSIDTELMFQHVKELVSGKSIDRPTYDFTQHVRAPFTERVHSASVIIFDGIFSLCYAEIRNLFDLKIFVDVDDDVRFIRRLRRDIAVRGRNIDSVIEQYLQTVRPMFIQHIKPTKAYADLVLAWEERNPGAIELLHNILTHSSPFRL